jgi:hypothetical protein
LILRRNAGAAKPMRCMANAKIALTERFGQDISA